jgi:hypothetical protein
VTAKLADVAEEIGAAGLTNPAVVIIAAGQRRPCCRRTGRLCADR